MLQSCFLQIAISQDWVDGFQISQSLWVKQALEHILIIYRLQSPCKQIFCVMKCPKTVLFQQFHICLTVVLDSSNFSLSTYLIAATFMNTSNSSNNVSSNRFCYCNARFFRIGELAETLKKQSNFKIESVRIFETPLTSIVFFTLSSVNSPKKGGVA